MNAISIIKHVIPVIVIVIALTMAACTSREQKVINGIKHLQERVEKNGAQFNEEQWGEVIDEYDALREESKRCDFTQSQLAELENAESALDGTIARQSPKELGREVGKIIKNGAEMLNDFVEGLKDGMSEDEVKDDSIN